MENWKDIPNWQGIYMVSDLGRIMRRAAGAGAQVGRVLQPSSVRAGYKMIRLMYDGRTEYKQVHRLVLEAFVGECPDKCEANHINGDPSDNRLENLEWTTRSDNLKHSYRVLGRKPMRGSASPQSKLNENLVSSIRASLADGFSYSLLAKEYQVSKACIAQIAKNRSWKHVKED